MAIAIKVRLGAVADVLTGFPFKSEKYTKSNSDPFLLRGDNIAQGVIRWDAAKHWPAEDIPQSSPYWLREDDVIIAMDRPWIEAGLKFAAVRESDLPALLVQRVARLRGTARLQVKFLRYVVSSKAFTDYVLGVQTGTAVPHISRSQIEGFEFALPPIAEQRAIASILGALDDKIELNRKMSATLEATARALFKSWFVDFDPARSRLLQNQDLLKFFGTSFQGSELGDIPSGWSIKTLDDVSDIIDCLHSKKPQRVSNGHLYIQLNNIADSGCFNLENQYSISADDYSRWTSRIEASPGDCVITNVGRVGAVAQIPEGLKGAIGRNMTSIRCRSDFSYPSFLLQLLLSENMRNEITLKTDSGTILDALNVRNISRLRFIEPPRGLLAEFESIVRPCRSRMETSARESQTLRQLRDVLLPKLVSGEICVSEAERFLEKSA